MKTEIIGTPVVTLGFTRGELDRMEEVAFPDSIEGWIHNLISAALGLLPTGAVGRDAAHEMRSATMDEGVFRR